MVMMQPDNNLPIKASGISRTFVQGPTSLEVLKGIDLEIEPGEMIAIIGTSGTGKTTLLQILGGLDRPTSGTIL
jgi:ABC-type lipoprotein export system ATPase subunit